MQQILNKLLLGFNCIKPFLIPIMFILSAVSSVTNIATNKKYDDLYNKHNQLLDTAQELLNHLEAERSQNELLRQKIQILEHKEEILFYATIAIVTVVAVGFLVYYLRSNSFNPSTSPNTLDASTSTSDALTCTSTPPPLEPITPPETGADRMIYDFETSRKRIQEYYGETLRNKDPRQTYFQVYPEQINANGRILDPELARAMNDRIAVATDDVIWELGYTKQGFHNFRQEVLGVALNYDFENAGNSMNNISPSDYNLDNQTLRSIASSIEEMLDL